VTQNADEGSKTGFIEANGIQVTRKRRRSSQVLFLIISLPSDLLLPQDITLCLITIVIR